jgi:hypothetical protein
MKGINSMIGIMIVFLIVITIFGWISIDSNVGEGKTEEIEDAALISEADRRLQKTQLYIKTSLGLSAQRGTQKSANQSGRLPKKRDNSYWMCKGSKQIPERDVVSYAASNATEEILKKRIDEVTGVRKNWVHSVTDLTCTETGYKTPLDSWKNDNFYVAAQVGEVKTQDKAGRIARAKGNYKMKEKVVYNRYWYLYSQLKKWTRNEGSQIQGKISGAIGSIDDRIESSESVCYDNESEEDGVTVDQLCKDNGIDPNAPPYGNYPDGLHLCREVEKKAEKLTKKTVKQEVEKIGENYFNGNVTCQAAFNNYKQTQYPGVKVEPDNPSQGPVDLNTKCGLDNIDDLEGDLYSCYRSMQHRISVWVDFTVICRDKMFRTTPRPNSLTNIKWKINMSMGASNTGSDHPRNQCSPKQGIQPQIFHPCGNPNDETNSCSTGIDINGQVDQN